MCIKIWICWVAFLALPSLVAAQGCSDAGFCSMGAMRPDQAYGKRLNLKLRSVELSQYLGISRFGDVINVTTAEFNISFSDRTSAQIKLPYMLISGPLGTHHGLGDISLSGTYALVKKEDFQVLASLGTKIPVNRADAHLENGAHLPMYYQTSLGTYDLIAGVAFKTSRWLVATGYQQVLIDQNHNQFFWGPYRELGLFAEAQQYESSYGLERGRDVMFRLERNFRFAKFNVFVGLLDVWRLNRDRKLPPPNPDQLDAPRDFVFVENAAGSSAGHALTLLYGLGYYFNTRSSIKLLVGHRLIKRGVNPDGLSRELVISTGYVFKF